MRPGTEQAKLTGELIVGSEVVRSAFRDDREAPSQP